MGDFNVFVAPHPFFFVLPTPRSPARSVPPARGLPAGRPRSLSHLPHPLFFALPTPRSPTRGLPPARSLPAGRVRSPGRPCSLSWPRSLSSSLARPPCRSSVTPLAAARRRGGASAVHMQHGVNVNYGRTPELSEANMVVFLGDFNYRLEGITYEEAVYLISQRRFDLLLAKDQLQVEMKAGRVFQGFQEAEIKFPPTYKFEKDQTELSGYDLSEKKHIPAWCDRIVFRDSRDSETDCSLACPVVSSILIRRPLHTPMDSRPRGRGVPLRRDHRGGRTRSVHE